MRALAAAALVGALAGTAAPAAEERKLGWSDTAEFSYVATAGNSETQTLGFKNALSRTWENALFYLRAGAVRAESTITTRVAVGPSASDFRVLESSTTTLTAESYFANAGYDRNISKRFFWHAGAGWDRNEFAGIEDRYVVEAGVGNLWVETETVRFRTTYAATYTKQDDVVEDPNREDAFAGGRLTWDYQHLFGTTTTYVNTLVFDQNLDETSDFRADMVNSVAVAMNRRLALKVSLQWLYDNQPSLQLVDLFNPPFPPGTPAGRAQVELDELDTIFTASLVVNL